VLSDILGGQPSTMLKDLHFKKAFSSYSVMLFYLSLFISYRNTLPNMPRLAANLAFLSSLAFERYKGLAFCLFLPLLGYTHK